MKRARVLVADDHAVLRAGLRMLLDGGNAADAAVATAAALRDGRAPVLRPRPAHAHAPVGGVGGRG